MDAVRGNAWLFGKSPAVALGANTNGLISEQAPVKMQPVEVGCNPGTKFVDGAAGKGNCFLIDSEGGVWGCGNNHCAQLGLVSNHTLGMWGLLTDNKALRREEEVSEFTKIEGPWSETKIVQVGWPQS